MKLITKTILYYLLISLPLLVIALFLSYTLIRSEVRDGTDEGLWKEKEHAEKLISNGQNSCLNSNSLSGIAADSSGGKGYQFKDTTVFDKLEGEDINYRMLKSHYESKGKNYRIIVAKPTLEEDELLEGLYSSLLIILGFLLISFFSVNWILSKTLWKPFYKTINKLDNYDLKEHSLQNFENSGTTEFSRLSEALNKMTDKIYTDFVQQKEFTENASHEMQTPLAVMKAKIELLMQSPNLKEHDMDQLQGIDTSISKLASLNKALLLLAKIENNQFKDVSEVSLEQVVNKVLVNYEDLIQSKGITIHKEIKKDIKLKMNPGLCDILIINLIQNAIRHNQPGGKINIVLENAYFSISNTGAPLNIQPEELFVRFKKNEASKESLGLGLSIVKGITDTYGLSIRYDFENNVHTFTLSMN